MTSSFSPSKSPALNGRSVISAPVFFPALGLIVALVLFGAVAPTLAESWFQQLQGWILEHLGWFYLLAVALFLVFCLFLALSRYGDIRLGPDHAQPEYRFLSWFAMLFTAGMGIGLLFFSVAEPLWHYANPLEAQPQSLEAARSAMSRTFFHWGLHAWAVYAVVGLALAFFSFRFDLPLTVRSSLWPLLGERIHGPIGHTVDVVAVLGTLFGVATSLGLGAIQINAGLSQVFAAPEDSMVLQSLIILVITLLATGSVVLGLDNGIRRASITNLVLATALLAFVFAAGPTLDLLRLTAQNTGTYLSEVVHQTMSSYAYSEGDDGRHLLGDWTLFYWGWWISWSPFVGMFIARISRGRTIREFITGVLLVPTAVTFLWMTVFGNTALNLDMGGAAGALSEALTVNDAGALFTLLDYLPLPLLTSILATVLVITFFVTSSDSASLVIDTLTSGGHANPPVWQRILWSAIEGAAAMVLLATGGLVALQTLSLVTALPFAAIILLMCYGLLRSLRTERLKQTAMAQLPATPSGNPQNWQKRLRHIVRQPGREAVLGFLRDTVTPALAAIREELLSEGYTAEMESSEESVSLRVFQSESTDFHYEVHLRRYAGPAFSIGELVVQRQNQDNARHYHRAEVFLSEGSQKYDIMGYTRDEVIEDVLAQYERHMQFLHLKNL